MKKKRDCRERQKIQDGGAGGGEKGGNPRTVELVEGKKGKISKWHRMLTFFGAKWHKVAQDAHFSSTHHALQRE